MKPYHVDHGGDGYQGRKKATRFDSAASVSLRCRECHKLTYRSRRELARAARPRCLGCGGSLDETAAQVRGKLGTERQRERRDRAVGDEIARIARRPKCWSCGRGHERAVVLAAHILASPECALEYFRDGKLVPVLVAGCPVALLMVPGTAHVAPLDRGGKRWAAEGVFRLRDGRFSTMTIGTFSAQGDALDRALEVDPPPADQKGAE